MTIYILALVFSAAVGFALGRFFDELGD